MTGDNILEIRGLKIYFHLDEGTLKAVDGVNLHLGRNETLGVIGESGCGKSLTAKSIIGILPGTAKIEAGDIIYRGIDGGEVNITSLGKNSLKIRSIRGGEIGMIFQEPMTSLSPVHTIGFQISEALMLHRNLRKKEAERITLAMLERVGISNGGQRFGEYIHQLSGGLRQRVMIAMALICSPGILIADEPTTSLDVTVQAQILDLMKNLQDELGMSIIYITHDLGVIAEVADRICVMYLGRIVQEGSAEVIFRNPMHPYTQKLIQSNPSLDGERNEMLETIRGNVPVPLNFPAMCGFYSRCHLAVEGKCNRGIPALADTGGGHKVRCFLVSDDEEAADG